MWFPMSLEVAEPCVERYVGFHESVRVEANTLPPGSPRFMLGPSKQATSESLVLKLGTDRHTVDEEAVGLGDQDQHANGVVFIE